MQVISFQNACSLPEKVRDEQLDLGASLCASSLPFDVSFQFPGESEAFGRCAPEGHDLALPGRVRREVRSFILSTGLSVVLHALVFGFIVLLTAGGFYRDSEPLPLILDLKALNIDARPNSSGVGPLEPAALNGEKKIAPNDKKKDLRNVRRPSWREQETLPHIREHSFSGSILSATADHGQEEGIAIASKETWTAGSPERNALPGSGLETASLNPSLSLQEAHPVYRENPAPGYPQVARRRGIEGMVFLEVFVNSMGRVGDLRVFQSSGHAILDHAALDAVRRWAFEPARLGDKAMEMWVKVPIRFELK
jgi:TonB family protein